MTWCIAIYPHKDKMSGNYITWQPMYTYALVVSFLEKRYGKTLFSEHTVHMPGVQEAMIWSVRQSGHAFDQIKVTVLG